MVLENKRVVIENENGLTKEQIIKTFKENENVNGGDCLWIYTTNLLEIIIKLKNGTKLNLMYGDRLEYIDLTLSDYIGLGGNLINPYYDIVFMEIRFR